MNVGNLKNDFINSGALPETTPKTVSVPAPTVAPIANEYAALADLGTQTNEALSRALGALGHANAANMETRDIKNSSLPKEIWVVIAALSVVYLLNE